VFFFGFEIEFLGGFGYLVLWMTIFDMTKFRLNTDSLNILV